MRVGAESCCEGTDVDPHLGSRKCSMCASRLSLLTFCFLHLGGINQSNIAYWLAMGLYGVS